MLHRTKKCCFLVTWILEVDLQYSFSDIIFTFILFMKHIPVHIYPCGQFSRKIPSQQWCDSTNCSISTPLKTMSKSCSVQHKKSGAFWEKKQNIFLPQAQVEYSVMWWLGKWCFAILNWAVSLRALQEAASSITVSVNIVFPSPPNRHARVLVYNIYVFRLVYSQALTWLRSLALPCQIA